MPRPPTCCRSRRIRRDDGWCEDPADRHYNQPVKVPRAISNADRLTRADDLYDFIVEIDHNTRPRVAGRGSAVFIHAARPGFAPTAGCIALDTQRHCAGCWRASARAPGSWSSSVRRGEF